MRGIRLLLTAILAGALSAVGWGGTALAGSTKAPPVKAQPQILSITAMRTSTTLDIVVRTTSVPTTYQVTERIYFYGAGSHLLGQCGTSASLHSGAGTGTSDTNPYSAQILAGSAFVRVQVDLYRPQVKRSLVIVDQVDSGLVAIPDLPAGWSSIGMNIWVR